MSKIFPKIVKMVYTMKCDSQTMQMFKNGTRSVLLLYKWQHLNITGNKNIEIKNP